MDFNLQIGLIGEKTDMVTEKNTAIQYGSGSVAVYATPAMVGLMENACLSAVDPHLPDGFATVGTLLNLRHLAATPLGLQVRAQAELTEIQGKKLTFQVIAFDEKQKIGEGIHERYIIDVNSFLEKANSKTK